MDLLPLAEEFYEKADDKIEALIRIAAAANSMEFGVKGHDFDNSTFAGVFLKTLCEKLHGDIGEVKRRLGSFSNIFYLTDNCGEVVFDLFVIGKLLEMGKQVVVGSKSEPVLNDVTVKELSAMTDMEVEVIATGNVVGTAQEHLESEACALLFDPGWLILSKGMGNFETISEFEERLSGRLIYIMRAKCEPVANGDWRAQGNSGGKIDIVIFSPDSSYPLLPPASLFRLLYGRLHESDVNVEVEKLFYCTEQVSCRPDVHGVGSRAGSQQAEAAQIIQRRKPCQKAV